MPNFITVPDFDSVKKDNTFNDHKKIQEGTYVQFSGSEKGLPHRFYTENETLNLFAKFKNVKQNWMKMDAG